MLSRPGHKRACGPLPQYAVSQILFYTVRALRLLTATQMQANKWKWQTEKSNLDPLYAWKKMKAEGKVDELYEVRRGMYTVWMSIWSTSFCQLLFFMPVSTLLLYLYWEEFCSPCVVIIYCVLMYPALRGLSCTVRWTVLHSSASFLSALSPSVGSLSYARSLLPFLLVPFLSLTPDLAANVLVYAYAGGRERGRRNPYPDGLVRRRRQLRCRWKVGRGGPFRPPSAVRGSGVSLCA